MEGGTREVWLQKPPSVEVPAKRTPKERQGLPKKKTSEVGGNGRGEGRVGE